VKGLWVDGRAIDKPVLKHAELVAASRIEFEMSGVPTDWGAEGI
jgi:putative alpha-1,2-mannosidase